MTRREEYAVYLDSDMWRQKKAAALKRAGYKCQKCGRAHKLHVHHKQYPKVFGDEPISFLEVLCIEHHADVHAEKLQADPNAPRNLLGYVKPKELMSFLSAFAAFPADKSDGNEKYRCKKCGKIHSPKFVCDPEVKNALKGGMK